MVIDIMVTVKKILRTRGLKDQEWEKLANTELGAQMIKNSIRLNRFDHSIKSQMILDKWLDQNTDGLYYMTGFIGDFYGETIYFELESDIVLFKMEWI